MCRWGDYPVRPRGNPLPQGVLLSIIFNSGSLEVDEIRDKKQRRNGVQRDMSLLLDLRRNAVKADDIKTGELSATSTSTYILREECTQTMYKQTKMMVLSRSEKGFLLEAGVSGLMGTSPPTTNLWGPFFPETELSVDDSVPVQVHGDWLS